MVAFRVILSAPDARTILPSGEAEPRVDVGRGENLANRGLVVLVSLLLPSGTVPAGSVAAGAWPLGKRPLARPPGWIRRFCSELICLKAIAERPRRELAGGALAEVGADMGSEESGRKPC